MLHLMHNFDTEDILTFMIHIYIFFHITCVSFLLCKKYSMAMRNYMLKAEAKTASFIYVKLFWEVLGALKRAG